MSLWEKIFSGKKKHSFGAPLQHECEQCGKTLHGGTGQVLSGGGIDKIFDHISKKVIQCPNCLRIFCPECSFEADKKLGRPKDATYFTCPFCRTVGITS